MNYKISAICNLERIEDPKDFNVDVYVTFESDTWYCITFFTVKNITTIMKNHKKSGESASGTYLWASDMLVVEEINRETIEITVADLVEEGIDKFGFLKGVDKGTYKEVSIFDI